MKKSILMVGAAALALTAPAFAEIEGEVTVGYSGQYNFRGVNFGNDLIEAGLSLSTEVAGFSLTAGTWVGDTAEVSDDEEIDVYFGIGKDVSIGGLEGNVEVGYTAYRFPSLTGVNTEEVYIALSTTVGCIDLGLTFIRDVDLIEEWYAEATAGYSHAICDSTSLDFELGAAYSFDYFGSDDFSHLWAQLSVPITISENATLTPYVKYVSVEDALDNSTLDAFGLSQDDEFFGGAVLSVSF